MAIDSSTSGLGSVTQFGWQQLKLQQAKRNADQAEQTARLLQQQASAAKSEADRAQEKARNLGVQADQAQSYAVRTRQGLSALTAGASAQSQLTYVIDQALNRPTASSSLTQSLLDQSTAGQDKFSSAANTQTATTGTIINTTA